MAYAQLRIGQHKLLLSMSTKYLFSAAEFGSELQGICYITDQQVGHNVSPPHCQNQIFGKLGPR